MQEFITLSAYGCTAKIRLSGAQIMSLVTPEGRELIWNGDPAVWPQHSTILFPICCAAKDDQVIIDGQAYPMNKHGFLKTAPFTVARLGDDFAELTYEANAETLAAFPFRFVFHVTYTLLENGYTTTFLVENLDEKPMPFCVGGHPGFMCPMAEGESFEDYRIVFDEEEEGLHAILNEKGYITGYEQLEGFRNEKVLKLKYDQIYRFDTIIMRDINSRGVSLLHKDTGHGLRMTFPKFPALALWTATGKKAPYLCIEPWIGLPAGIEETGRMEEKPYVVTLAPGRCCKAWFTTTTV